MATRITGKVLGIGVDREGTQIILDNDPNIGPKDNQFMLRLDHSNYNALYSLVLAAAANRWTIHIRISGDGQIDPTLEAGIRNIGVDWK
jgi:hypothetical protein